MQYVKDTIFLKALENRIRLLRVQKKLSQLYVGASMDNYAEQIGRIERGELNVTICTLKKIAEALSVTLNELFIF